MRAKPVYFLVAALLLASSIDSRRRRNQSSNRDGKLLNMFQIIRFPNVPCQGSSRNGTCYTREECQARGGVAEANCANGFGVCCLFEMSCGSISRENCTFFTSPSTFPIDRPCKLTICPCESNICQLRLDFMSFVITGPSTDTNEAGSELFGNPSPSGGQPFSNAGRCLTDTFTVTNPGGTNPPVICGFNTQQHMYVDASEQCNDLTFQFSSNALGTNLANRAFDIKVSQYSCNFNNLAPPGCTQWYFGSNTGQVQTYNYNNYHLANQRQNICIRREEGLCRICWSTENGADFGLSGRNADGGIVNPNICCQYGAQGGNSIGYDCAIIRGARSALGPLPSRFCGRNAGLVGQFLPLAQITVCTVDTTFMVTFVSDATETLVENMENNVGFKLGFEMDAVMCD